MAFDALVDGVRNVSNGACHCVVSRPVRESNCLREASDSVMSVATRVDPSDELSLALDRWLHRTGFHPRAFSTWFCKRREREREAHCATQYCCMVAQIASALARAPASVGLSWSA